MAGKWGLGHEGSTGLPTRQGFDFFFGYLDQHHAHNYYPSFLIRDEQRVMLDNEVPGEGEFGQGVATQKRQYSHDLIVEEALELCPTFRRPTVFPVSSVDHPSRQQRGRQSREWRYRTTVSTRTKTGPNPRRAHAAMISRMDRDIGRLDGSTE